MRIPLTDLAAQYAGIKDEIDGAVRRVISSGSFILGPEVEAFEQEMAAYCGTSHAVGVASGTDALQLALLACGVGPGDEVITTPFTFIATTEAIVSCGATPVFADIEPETFNLDPSLVEQHITPRTKALVPVHLYGHPCDMTRIVEIARRHGLKVIEDCAQALGATWMDQHVGCFGDAGCPSFSPSKVPGAYGDGGMVVTNDADVAERVRILRNHGGRVKYYHGVNGFNSRLDALQAAVLRVKLGHLNAWLKRRREIAAAYKDGLANIEDIATPTVADGAVHAFNYYTIRVAGGAQRRNALAALLKSHGIASAVYYPLALHLQVAYRQLGHAPGGFPVAEVAQEAVLSLPIYPEMTVQVTGETVNSIRAMVLDSA
ncbi:MAG: DegT/DnrJ/EryC1/StrS family aminotransferase [Chloroflexi bacterium]|nr:DegT/DnrJ/EryC1/StrS family aminotransferase [Chloroflexota bacterium]